MTEIDENLAEAPADLLAMPEIKEALDNLLISGFSKAELEGYDKYWDSIRTEKTLHSGFLEKGRAEGREEGFYLSAILLLRSQMAEDSVASVLNLSIEIVRKLKGLIEKYGLDAEKHIAEVM